MTEPDDIPTPPDEEVPSYDKERRALETILRKTRRSWERPIVVEGVLWVMATLAAVAISSLLIAAIVPTATGALVASWILRVGAALVVGAGLLVALRWSQRGPELRDVASLLQRHTPSLRNDVVAALQFARELESDVVYSREMAEEHIRRTARNLLGLVGPDGSLASMLPKRDTRPAVVAVSVSLIVLTVAAVFSPETIKRVVHGTETGDPSHVDARQRAVVGDIDLFYTYPPYTDLQARLEVFSTGHIEALEGTDIRLRTYPILPAEKYEMVLETEDGTRTIALDERQGRLEANFLATKEGTYQFRAVLGDGSVIQDGIERTIRLLPDTPPKVMITSHSGEIEVGPEDRLELKFTVTDDFGVEAVARSHGFMGDTPDRRAIDVPGLVNVPTEFDGVYVLDLASMALQPKDVVVFTLEASDNNTLTGPGKGVSEELVLRVASPEDKHMRVIAQEQEALEALIEVLAGFLENPVGDRQPNSRDIYEQRVPSSLSAAERAERFVAFAGVNLELGKAIEFMHDVVGRMKEDPLMLKRDFDLFSSLHDQLYAIQRDGLEVANRMKSRANEKRLTRVDLQGVADQAATTEDALEKGILRLEELLAAQKMEAIKGTAEDIKELKERLRELLEKYKETRDPELKKAIEREIKRLRQRMMELMQRMQSQLQKLPQEHVNMEAVEAQQMESDAQKLADEMTSIEDLLEKGDIDGALEALDRMGQNLDSLTDDMDKKFDAAQPEGLSELDKKLSNLMDQVNDLETLQRDVEEQTSDVQREVQEAQRKQMEKMVERFAEQMLREVRDQVRDGESVAESVPKFERHTVEDVQREIDGMKQGLEAQDVEEALDKAESSLEQLRTLQFSIELSQRYARKGSKQARDMKKSVEKLGEMIERGQRIKRELGSMMEKARQEMAQADDSQMGQLSQRQKQVSGESERLRKSIEDAAQEFPMLKQELEPGVQQAQRSMNEAESSLKKNMTQRALDDQRQALDELRKLKQSMQQSLQKQKMDGNGNKVRREAVEIPEKSAESEGKGFREDVMKNMREGRLENYSDEIERYYKSLME